MPSRSAPTVSVYLRPPGGGNILTPLTAHKVLAIERTAGGGRQDRCTLQVDLDQLNTRVQNLALAAGSNYEVSVVAQIGTIVQPLHWGKTAISELDVGSGGESVLLTSRIEDFHFGSRLYGMVEFDPVSGQPCPNGNELVFNPWVNGFLIGNMSSRRFGPGNAAYFVDPYSMVTAPGRSTQNVTAGFWTLPEAINYLCWVLNSAQPFISNPSTANLLAVLPSSPSLITNVTIPHGMGLQEILDMLLHPLGYGWFVQLSGGTAGFVQRQIVVFRRGVGVPRQVAHQAVGQTLTIAQTPLPGVPFSNAPGIRASFGIQNVVNQVTILGNFHRVESTWNLIPAWTTAQSTTPFEELAKGHPNYSLNSRIWRDWVLNEAGDYNGLGAATQPYDLAAIFGYPLIPRRRVFEPTLTQAYDFTPIGEFAGAHVEYSVDGGTTWGYAVNIEDYYLTLLEGECGIRFNNILPPLELYEAGVNARVRITATISSDRRMFYTTPVSGTSPQTDISPVILDMRDRFFWNVIHPNSGFYAQVQAGQYLSFATNDIARLAIMANELLANWDVADVSGQIVLEGLDGWQYELGELLTGVTGRNLDFSAKVGGARYPQIVGQMWDVQNQKRVISFETYRGLR